MSLVKMRLISLQTSPFARDWPSRTPCGVVPHAWALPLHDGINLRELACCRDPTRMHGGAPSAFGLARRGGVPRRCCGRSAPSWPHFPQSLVRARPIARVRHCPSASNCARLGMARALALSHMCLPPGARLPSSRLGRVEPRLSDERRSMEVMAKERQGCDAPPLYTKARQVRDG